VHALSADEPHLAEIARALNEAGVMVLAHGSGDPEAKRVENLFRLEAQESDTAEQLAQRLEEEGIIPRFAAGL
jgi:hypothetical protein